LQDLVSSTALQPRFFDKRAVCGHEGDAVMENWIDIGSVDELSAASLKRVTVLNREFAVSF
jgi:hypothetical protein